MTRRVTTEGGDQKGVTSGEGIAKEGGWVTKREVTKEEVTRG